MLFRSLLALKPGTSQTVQGTILPGTAANSVIFALKSSGAFSAPFTNVQFVLQIPNTVTPIPTVQIKNNFLATYIPTYNFNAVSSTTPIAFSNEGGYYNYLFSSAPTGAPLYSFTTTQFNVLELEIINGPLIYQTVRFAHLAGGGASSQHNFYIEADGLDYTNVAAMFYGA